MSSAPSSELKPYRPTLHQRFLLWRSNWLNRKTARAVRHLEKELRGDIDFWRSYHANYACVVADQLQKEFRGLTQYEAMELGNNCADRIMAHFYKAPRRPDHYP